MFCRYNSAVILKTDLESQKTKNQSASIDQMALRSRLARALKALETAPKENQRAIFANVIQFAEIHPMKVRLGLYAPSEPLRAVAYSDFKSEGRTRGSSTSVSVGAGDVSTDAHSEPDDIISFLADRRPIISEQIFKFYENGYSCLEISQELGVPEGSIRHYVKTYLKSAGAPGELLRKVEQRNKAARGGNVPYGFLAIHNKRVEHPKEQLVVQQIMKLWKSGKGCFSIAQTFNSRGITSRKNSKWRHGTIARIIDRIQKGRRK